MRMKKFIIAGVIGVLIGNAFCGYAQSKEEEAFYVAEKAFLDKFYQASVTLFEKFINDYPESGNLLAAKLYIAKSLYFQQNYVKALTTLEQLKTAPGNEEIIDQVYYWLGQISFQGKNFPQALEYAQDIITEHPDSSLIGWAHYLSAECYVQMDQYAESEKELEAIVSKSEDRKLREKAVIELLNVYYLQQKYNQLVSYAEDALSRLETRQAKSQLFFYKGEGHYGKNEFETARKIFAQGLNFADEENLVDLYLQRLGDCFLSLDNEAQARAYYDRIASDELKSYSFINYYLHLKQCNEVFASAEEFLEKFPSSTYIAQVYLHKADCLYDLGRVNDALSVYQEIVTKFDSSSLRNVIDQAHYGLAWCYLKVGEFKKAIEGFKETIQFTDNFIVRVSSQIQIADAYQEKEMYDAALETYNRILKEYPDNIYSDYIQFQIGMIFLKNDRLEEAKFSFKNLEKTFPESKLTPQAQYYLAASYFSEGNYRPAEDILKTFSQRFPNHTLTERARYLYGKCLFNQGQYQKALDIFHELISSISSNELRQVIFIDTAYAYLNLNREDKAKEILDEFTRRFRQSRHLPSVLLNLGNLHEQENDYERAQTYYERIIRDHPHGTVYYEAKLALAHLFWQKGDLTKAEQHLKELASGNNENARQRATLYLGDMYAQQQDAQAAFKLYEEVIRSQSRLSTMARAKKGMLLKENKRYAEAVSTIGKAIDEGVEDPQLYLALGYCLEKIEADEDALAEYFKVVYLHQDSHYTVKAYFRIAKIYREQNQLRQAKEIYEKIAAIDVGEAKIARERIEEIDKELKK